MSTVISVEQLSKIYHLGQIGTGTFTNDLIVWWAKTRGKPNPLLKIGQVDHNNGDGEELWALRDISFTVEQGEALGIIGRNGAGKSTLLKILSRVTAPTSGKVKVKGRIGSLLEVGTGFHPELTGRENVYLNGAILGMKKTEVKQKFDEIVDFSGVEKFIDTPVKRYSSGMYVRLAFAVAAHLDPDILIVDEVLAVGDADFQRKCLAKMGEVAGQGRTVLLVSHNMGSIRALCNRAILLSQGRIHTYGDPEKVIRGYLSTNDSFSAKWVIPSEKQKGDAYFQEISIKNSEGKISGHIDCREEIQFNIILHVLTKISAHIHVRFTNTEGIPVFTTASSDSTLQDIALDRGCYHFSFTVPGNFLSPGRYTLIVAVIEPRVRPIDVINGEISFFVEDTGYQNPLLRDSRLGVVNPLFEWKKEYTKM